MKKIGFVLLLLAFIVISLLLDTIVLHLTAIVENYNERFIIFDRVDHIQYLPTNAYNLSCVPHKHVSSSGFVTVTNWLTDCEYSINRWVSNIQVRYNNNIYNCIEERAAPLYINIGDNYPIGLTAIYKRVKC